MAKRRRRRSKRTNPFAKVAGRGRRRRRSSSGGGGIRRGRMLAGVVSTDVLKSAGAGTGGFVAIHFIADKIADLTKFEQAKTGNGRIALKAASALALGYIARKAGAPSQLATAATVGGLIAVGIDLYNKFGGKSYTAGMGVIEPDGVDYYAGEEGIPLEGDYGGGEFVDP